MLMTTETINKDFALSILLPKKASSGCDDGMIILQKSLYMLIRCLNMLDIKAYIFTFYDISTSPSKR
jgi:hypothetical protein